MLRNIGGNFELPQLATGSGLLTDEVRAFFESCGCKFNDDRNFSATACSTMSALGRKRTNHLAPKSSNVRFTPNSEHYTVYVITGRARTIHPPTTLGASRAQSAHPDDLSFRHDISIESVISLAIVIVCRRVAVNEGQWNLP